MKKFYTILVSTLLAICAFAQDGAPLYLTGDCPASNWNPGAPLEFVYADGQYTLEVKDVKQFKMSTVKGSWAEFNAGSLNCAKLYSGSTQTLYSGEENIVLGWKGDYTLTVSGDLSTITAYTETPNPDEGKFPALYIRGTFNSWGTDTPFNTEDGINYVASGVNMSVDDKFKIATADWADYNFGSIVDIVVGTTYTLENASNSSDCTLAMPMVNATFNLNLEEGTLLIQGEGDVPVVVKKLYVVGENYGNWGPNMQYLMNLISDDETAKVYEIDLPYLTGEWKIFDGTWKYSFGAGFDEVELDKDIEAFFNSSANFSCNIEEAVKLTLIIPAGADEDGSSIAAVITITKLYQDNPDPIPAPEHLYMLGDVNGSGWSLENPVELVKDGNVFTLASVQIGDSGSGFGYFSFASQVGATWDDVKAGPRYGALFDGQYMDDQLPGQFKEYMGEAPAWTTSPATYAVKVDFDTCSVEFTLLDSVEAIEADNAPAVYYNLQGQQVVNPAAGIYVKKAGSKVSKVYIVK